MQKPTPTNKEITFSENEFIVSKTDLKGNITYGNDLFIEISGYTESELLNKPHNILRHPDMPRIIFKYLWNYIQNSKEIFAYVKNLTKDGSYYWVHAYVTPAYDENRNIIGYHSVRRKPTKEALDIVIPLYEKLLHVEKASGMDASENELKKVLNELKVSYDEFSLRYA